MRGVLPEEKGAAIVPKEISQYTSYALLVPLLAGSIWLLFDKSALRDQSSASPKPYSFARAQLWWWTTIILVCYIVLYGRLGNAPLLGSSVGLLFGMSAITTAAGRLVDTKDAEGSSKPRRHQEDASEGFISDILSDGAGVSVHRFQAAMFNIAYGVYFAVEVIANLNRKALPTLDPSALALLGVSSTTYLAMKVTENAPKHAAAATDAAATSKPGGPTTGPSSLAPTAPAATGMAHSDSDELLDPLPLTDLQRVTDN